MCHLCETPEEAAAGREFCDYMAEELTRLAAYYRQMARGSLKPHTTEMKQVRPLAYAVIRYLVQKWV